MAFIYLCCFIIGLFVIDRVSTHECISNKTHECATNKTNGKDVDLTENDDNHVLVLGCLLGVTVLCLVMMSIYVCRRHTSICREDSKYSWDVAQLKYTTNDVENIPSITTGSNLYTGLEFGAQHRAESAYEPHGGATNTVLVATKLGPRENTQPPTEGCEIDDTEGYLDIEFDKQKTVESTYDPVLTDDTQEPTENFYENLSLKI